MVALDGIFTFFSTYVLIVPKLCLWLFIQLKYHIHHVLPLQKLSNVHILSFSQPKNLLYLKKK